jgi:hypothetical protein
MLTRLHFAEDDLPSADKLPSDVERFILTDGGNVIATFERREVAEAPGKPWLDRVGSSYEWIPIEEPLTRKET